MRSLWGHMTENTTKKTISRRAVAGGMAWSVPAIAFASAAPAATVSPLFTVDPVGGACKYPGNSTNGVFQAYMIPVQITNIANERVCVSNVSGSVTFEGRVPSGSPKWWTDKPHLPGAAPLVGDVCLDPGKLRTLYYVIDRAGNSGNRAGVLAGTYLGTGQTTGRQSTAQISVSFTATPPDCTTGKAFVEPSPTEAAEASPTTAAEPSPATSAARTTTAEPSPTTPAEPTTTAEPTPTAPAESSAPAVSESAAAPTQP